MGEIEAIQVHNDHRALEQHLTANHPHQLAEDLTLTRSLTPILIRTPIRTLTLINMPTRMLIYMQLPLRLPPGIVTADMVVMVIPTTLIRTLTLTRINTPTRILIRLMHMEEVTTMWFIIMDPHLLPALQPIPEALVDLYPPEDHSSRTEVEAESLALIQAMIAVPSTELRTQTENESKGTEKGIDHHLQAV